MTWYDLVRQYFPDATDKQCSFILWECTPFPCCGVDTVKEYLQEYKNKLKNK